MTTTSQTVTNSSATSNPDYNVRVKKNAAGEDLQVFIPGYFDSSSGAEILVNDANPLPVTGTLISVGQLVTYSLTRPSFSSASSATVIAANSSRKAGSYLVNNTDYTFWLAFDANAAVANQGPFIVSGGIYLFNSRQRINAIQTSGGILNLDCIEAT